MTEPPNASNDGCVFCAITAGELTPDVIAFRDEDILIFPSLHQHPENRGHTLVIPVQHLAHIYDVDRKVGGPLLAAVAAAARAVKQLWSADGVSVRQNNEPAGGQDVFHVHFHVIPRYGNESWKQGSFSSGLVEVPHAERKEQAKKLSQELRGTKW